MAYGRAFVTLYVPEPSSSGRSCPAKSKHGGCHESCLQPSDADLYHDYGYGLP